MNQVKGNGASSTLFQHDKPNKPKVSKFDYSRKRNFTIDVGQIMPVDAFEVYPGDIVNLNEMMSLDTLPLVQPSITNYKIVTHWYYMKYRDCWKGWKTFSTKGRSGNVNLTVPQVDLRYSPPSSVYKKVGYPQIFVDGKKVTLDGDIIPVSHQSLSNAFRIPAYVDGIGNIVNDEFVLEKSYLPYTVIPNSSLSGQARINYVKGIDTEMGKQYFVSALPFVAYQSIVKNNYVPQNLLQDCTALFPVEGDDDWLLPYDIKDGIANYISGRSRLTVDDFIGYNGVFNADKSNNRVDTDVDLRQLRYACYDDDYFTTALPWLQRGDIQSLSFDMSGSNVSVDVATTLSKLDSDSFLNQPVSVTLDNNGRWLQSSDTNVASYVKDGYENLGSISASGIVSLSAMLNALNARTATSVATAKLNNANISFTANQLRSLIAMSVWQERNSYVDGSYNKMIFQHWLSNPRSEEHKPQYIGGSVDYLNFSTVIQNSQSTDDSPLGSTAGFGNAQGKGSIARFAVPDYGCIIGVMIIKPETYYQQGVEHWLTQKTFEDFPQPEFQMLSPEPIINKELYIDDVTDNEGLFGYQERYTYLKVRENCNVGHFQVKPTKDRLFASFTQARWFSSRPKLSYQFLCMSPDNIRRDWLAYPVYPAFRCQFLTQCSMTRKFAYKSEPNTFGF